MIANHPIVQPRKPRRDTTPLERRKAHCKTCGIALSQTDHAPKSQHCEDCERGAPLIQYHQAMGRERYFQNHAPHTNVYAECQVGAGRHGTHKLRFCVDCGDACSGVRCRSCASIANGKCRWSKAKRKKVEQNAKH